jgi:HAD superfamily hydrolase (TIGR01509 family)
MKPAHIGLRVNNLYIMKLFYIRVLGFKEQYVYKSQNTPGLETVFLTRGALGLELLRYGDAPAAPNGSHFALYEKNVDREAVRLRNLGVEILRGPKTTGDGCRELEFADPEGNIIELSRRIGPPPRYPLKAVIFDLDGTVIDSEDNYHEADRLLLSHYGIEFTREMKSGFIGMGNYSMMEKIKRMYNLPDTIEQMTEVKNKIYLELALKETRIFHGMFTLIKKLYAAKMPMALATGSSPEVVNKLISLLDLGRYFPIRLSADEVGKGKPEPDLFLETAKRLGVDPYNCAVVEDSKFGVEAAARARMRCIAVPSVVEQPPADAFFTADLYFRKGMRVFNHRKTYRWIMRRARFGG